MYYTGNEVVFIALVTFLLGLVTGFIILGIVQAVSGKGSAQ